MEITFVTPILKPRGKLKLNIEGNLIPKTLTQKQATFTAHVHSVHSRVENPFGRLRQKIDALALPFWEGKEQLGLSCLVWGRSIKLLIGNS